MTGHGRSGTGYNDAQKWADGLQGRPVGIRIIASLQGSLSSARLRLTQARIRSPPGLTPSHIFSMLDLQTSQISEIFVSLARQGALRVLMFSLIQILMRLSPGCTPPHFALMSAEHACSIDNFCAVAPDAEKERTTPIIRTVLNIVQPSNAVTHREYFEPLTTNQIERRANMRGTCSTLSAEPKSNNYT